MLHITNGGATLRLMGPAGLPGEFLPWQDVLHEGPVPAGLGLDALSEVRARYLADCGWGDYPRVLADFRRRDQRLQHFTEHAEVVLWFDQGGRVVERPVTRALPFCLCVISVAV